MFAYNVSIKLESAIADEWLRWMREEHVHEVLATGCFYDYKLFRLVADDENEDPTFVVQYFCNKKTDYQRYVKEFAPLLQRKGIEKFGQRFTAFRSLMELI
jgi:hypothetical protein